MKVEVLDINGTYYVEDNSAIGSITVSGNNWSGSIKIISGLGDAYDNKNKIYDRGIVNGSDVFDKSGHVKIGYIQGKELTTSLGNSRVTLVKK